MLAVSSSWAIGWSTAFHVANDHQHDADAPDDDAARGLQMMLHGHSHAEGTPAHGHFVLGSVAAPVPGKTLLLLGAMIGDAPESVCCAASGRRVPSGRGPTHDPPPRLEAVSILRI